MLTDLSTILPPNLLPIVRLALPRPRFIVVRPLTPETHPALARKLAAAKVSVLTLAEVYEDATNIIRRCATRYADESHPILNADNLYSEGLAKLAEMERAGKIAAVKERIAFFSYLKKAILRHLWRFVLAQKFTLKRTGVAPPRSNPGRQAVGLCNRVPEVVRLDGPTSGNGFDLDALATGPAAPITRSRYTRTSEIF